MKVINLILYALATLPSLYTSDFNTDLNNCILEDPLQRVDAIQQIESYIEKGKYFLYKPESFKLDMDSAYYFFRKAEHLSQSIHNKELLAESFLLQGETLYEDERYDQALIKYNLTISYYKRTKKINEEAWVMQLLGERYFWKTPRDFKTLQIAIDYFDKAILLYQRLDMKEQVATNLKNKADAHLNQGRLELAESELLQVLKIYKAINFEQLHYTYDLLADVYRLKGDLANNLFYSYECVKSMERTGDIEYAPSFYMQLGLAYRDIGNSDLCIEWLKRAAFNLDFSGNQTHYFLFDTINLLSQELVKAGRTKEALAVINKLLIQHPPETNLEKAQIAAAQAYCYDKDGQIELAERNYLNCIEFYESYSKNLYPIDLANAYFDLGEFYQKHKNYTQAKHYIEKTLQFPQGIVELAQIKNAKYNLSKIDSAQGNYFSALKHYQEYKVLNDSIFNISKSKQIEELQILYDVEKKEKQLALLQSDFDIEKQQTSKAKSTTNLVLGILGLCMIILFLLWKSYQLKQKKNRLLLSQKSEIDQKNRVLERLVEDKEFLIKEIHHRVKNNLQIVMSLLNSQSATLKNKEALDAIIKSQNRLYAISLIHQKLYATNTVKHVDMDIYIRDLITNLKNTFSMESSINFVLDIDPISLEENQAVSVGLILNETITNSIKYGFSKTTKGTIVIHLKSRENQFIDLKIKDDGVGLPENFDFDLDASLGMNLIKGLSKQLNGKACFTSKNGLLITITFTREVSSDRNEGWALKSFKK